MDGEKRRRRTEAVAEGGGLAEDGEEGESVGELHGCGWVGVGVVGVAGLLDEDGDFLLLLEVALMIFIHFWTSRRKASGLLRAENRITCRADSLSVQRHKAGGDPDHSGTRSFRSSLTYAMQTSTPTCNSNGTLADG